MSNKPIQNVAIVGASGHIGGAFIKALQSTGQHDITAITRPESKGTIPAGVKTVRVSYDDEDGLISALKDQQFFIISLAVRSPPETHGNLVNAATKAGVPYIMPNIYGHDVKNTQLLKDCWPMVLDWVEQCEKSTSGTVTMVCGYWYEWSLILGEQWFGFDIPNKKVTFYDDGTTKINVSTWEQCGRALAALLSLPEQRPAGEKGYSLADWKNKPLYISSWKLSQRDMLDSIHRVTGDTDTDWEITHEPSDKRYRDGHQEVKDGNWKGYAKQMYARVFYPNGDGDYESVRGLDNDKLGLPQENLDETTAKALELVKSGFNPFA